VKSKSDTDRMLFRLDWADILLRLLSTSHGIMSKSFDSRGANDIGFETEVSWFVNVLGLFRTPSGLLNDSSNSRVAEGHCHCSFHKINTYCYSGDGSFNRGPTLDEKTRSFE
jgi:hypothetical protein